MSIQYLLTNVTFDNTYKNVPYFSNVTDRDIALIGDKQFTTTNHNFNFGNVLYTSFVVNTYNWENYLIIKDTNNHYRFYFVTQCDYKSVNQWVLTLELDVITQYINGIDSTVLSDCYVERAHCNRFKYQNNELRFDISNESQIIQSEKNINMVTKYRNDVKPVYCENVNVNRWLNNNVLCWVYYYVDKSHPASFEGAIYETNMTINTFTRDLKSSSYTIGQTKLTNEYSIIACPVYKEDSKIYIIDKEHRQSGCLDKIENYRVKNNDNSYIYNIKYSMKSPVDFNDITPYVSFDESNNMIIEYTANYGFSSYEDWEIGDATIIGNSGIIPEIVDGVLCAHRTSSCFINVNTIEQEFSEIDIWSVLVFNPNAIVRGRASTTYEPKILVDCRHVVIRDSSNGEWVYPALYFNKAKVKPIYTEPNNITNTNYYYRLEPTGIIPQFDDKNWNGIANTVDYSQQIANNNYESFIANNKNFLLTKQVQQLPNIAFGMLGDVSSIGNIASSVFDTMTQIGNIKNKPNTMACVNDTVELNLTVNKGIKLYVDIDEPRDVDKQQYFNYIYSHGYQLNKFCNPCDYIGTRKYFNYVKCELEGVNIAAPDNVINKIRSIFRNGVRLWNEYEDMYNYNMENYERWLEELI